MRPAHKQGHEPSLAATTVRQDAVSEQNPPRQFFEQIYTDAVERGNRRYRKMQKSVYRVRTQALICTRLALDMWREAYAEGRQQTLAALHRARAG